MILNDVGVVTKANERLREVIEVYEMAFGIEHPQKLKSEEARAALSQAAGNGYYTVVGLLLMKDGADADSKNSQSGQTPLSWATFIGHQAVAKLLLNTGTGWR